MRDLVTLDRELGRLCQLLTREGRQLASVVASHEALQSALGPHGGVGRIAKRVRGLVRPSEKPPEIAHLHAPPTGPALGEHYREEAGQGNAGTPSQGEER